MFSIKNELAPTGLTGLCFALLISLVAISCEPDPCSTVFCENGGVCDNGVCDCPPGAYGQFCEYQYTVQQRLYNGEDPLDIVASGVPVSDLYGQFYEGGIIFYLDVDDELPNIKGMVTTEIDAHQGVEWGCFGEASPSENGYFNGNSYAGPGFVLGSGAENSRLIAESCPENPNAARICEELDYNFYDDWFLPSGEELLAMQKNLAQNGYGNFVTDGWYWSSTELDNDLKSVLAVQVGGYIHGVYWKSNELRVRAARAF